MNIPASLFTGKNRIYFPELDSTNTYAMDVIAKTNPPEGTCIYTDFQTAGRGQIGRCWHSKAGDNLLLSYIFYPRALNVSSQFYLNIVSSLAVLDVLKMWCPDAKIKWPNDLYVGNNKIAGILVQNTLRGFYIKSTVIGIGLNINQNRFPADLPNPTSLFLETGVLKNKNEIMQWLDARLEYHYLRLQASQWNSLRNDYLSDMYKLHEWAFFRSPGKPKFLGKITGIDEQGKLLICLENQDIASFGFREIEFLFDPV